MADNYLEKQMEQYQARKSAWLRQQKPVPARPKKPVPALHRFARPVAGIDLPPKLNSPFGYTPHPLCIEATRQVQDYIAGRADWADELQRGKMFGVLVVRDAGGRLGYFAAYSGLLAGRNDHPYFVPPVYDLLRPDGFFKQEEEQISLINRRIREAETSEERRSLLSQLTTLRQAAADDLAQTRQRLKEAKALRDARRAQAPLTEAEAETLVRESQHQKADYKRLERSWAERLRPMEEEAARHEADIRRWHDERKTRSAALQQRLFAQFRMRNALGEERDLCDIFARTPHHTPPAGAGECAAPKLLQHAYLHHCSPVAMAEFWWGDSPKTEVRHHGHFYPACRGKCGPILAHMLQGLDVEPDPFACPPQAEQPSTPETVYEDAHLIVVCKPAGLLSVPGKGDAPSVCTLLRQSHPQTDVLLPVHRLDMDTSGLMIVAKTKAAYQQLQAQFARREVKKRYMALLDGIVATDEGCIDLPLAPDPMDRPRQQVHPRQGKPALTHYQVLQRTDRRTRIAFFPQTGRTHQLRIHAAHPQGLHCPIVGDNLYGTPADRLYLHAEMLEFTHPVTGETVHVERKAEF